MVKQQFARLPWVGPMRLVTAVALLMALAGSWVAPARAAQGGPIVLMGIDAEDCGPGGHGPINTYIAVVNSILSKVSIGGSGILVIGGTTSCVRPFWNAIDTALPSQTVTYVSGASAISSQSFAGFAMIAVASDQFNTSGGLTGAENVALGNRKTDVAAFVNNGGGLLGFSSDFTASQGGPYPYLGGFGTFTFNTNLGYDNITPTADGTAVGISNALDLCCWHDEYLTYPSFLKVLATNAGTGRAAAIGGGNVVISSIQLAPTGTSSNVGIGHTVTATVAENGLPVANRTVTFTVLSGPHAGQTGTGLTNANSQATFTYTGTAPGIDTIEARYVDSSNNPQSSNRVTHEWLQTNSPPQANAGGPYQGVEGSPVSLSGTASDPDNDPLTITWSYHADPATVDSGTTCAFTSGNTLTPTFTCTDDGLFHVLVTVSDGVNAPATESVAVTILNNVAPAVLNVQVGDMFALTNGTATVNLQAGFKDPGTNDSHTCMISWDDGTTASSVSTAAGVTQCGTSHGYTAAGVYTIQVTVTDDDGGADAKSVIVVVYDPNGGFVTGGGTIGSKAGAYTLDPSLAGKAVFGFVSKYQKGAATPIGDTEFQFQVASLNFHSEAYQWLVISGVRAQYKGTGTVNGVSGYGFLLSAYDGQLAGADGTDRFRMKIWDANEAVIYDNAVSASDDIDLSNLQALDGGSIVIHKK